MTGSKRSQGFTRKTRDYLAKLDAVDHVTATRIYYTPEFSEQAMRQYDAGVSPVEIFRQAGLDPNIIGRKRIERCFARWRDRQRIMDPSLPPLVPDHHRTKPIADGSDAAASTTIAVFEHERMLAERDRLIASQALRIANLEAEVGRLMRIAIDHAEAANPDEEDDKESDNL